MIRKLGFYIVPLFMGLVTTSVAADSQCYGTTAKGKLKNGVELPMLGKNFVSYGQLAGALGRTYVHSTVRDIVLGAYHSLQSSHPDKVFKYAETGFKEGGRFKPHKTHQNGLSVDFMTPVIDINTKNSVHLPTHALNRFGYDIEFNNNSRYENYQIDYEAIAAHLIALHKESIKYGVEIWRVIFDPKLQPMLLSTSGGEYIKANIELSKRRSWVRHDEHYHVDFNIPCLPLK
ncbi:penicillin-insensitive murein endopeptidase [Pleionea sediminis]|uniref:penicillin-insensitive murein endopeptidase n=1 Tax=Pleionea sediminis TaxID=2569479 RepID=UPI001185A2E9|nr:penicillin-insensitive murein endopeptidase [Pleionea sediminis]